MRRLLAALIGSSLTSGAPADTVHLKSGGSLDCTVVQESKDAVTVVYGSGLLAVQRSMIERVEREAPAPPAAAPARMPTWRHVVVTGAAQEWATELRQIPATVITVGVLRHVPYKSHRCGKHYEINVYGDPDAPSGFEAGVTGALANDTEARERCLALVASLLPNGQDAETVRSLNRTVDRVEREDLVFEVTPPDAPDAYGGWWVSVYSKALLDRERASEQELARITAPLRTPSHPERPASQPEAAQDEFEKRLEALESWSREEMRQARPAPTESTSSGGGSVYVRGYYRKDGTYVRAHTRSRARR